MHISIDGTEYSLDDAELRGTAAQALRDAGLERAEILPPCGREFCSDGLFSYEGVINANALMLQLWERLRPRHFDETHSDFVGYTAIPVGYVLLSLTEKLFRPTSPSEISETEFASIVADTMREADAAIDTEALAAELDGYACNYPITTTEVNLTMVHSGRVTIGESC